MCSVHRFFGGFTQVSWQRSYMLKYPLSWRLFLKPCMGPASPAHTQLSICTQSVAYIFKVLSNKTHYWLQTFLLLFCACWFVWTSMLNPCLQDVSTRYTLIKCWSVIVSWYMTSKHWHSAMNRLCMFTTFQARIWDQSILRTKYEFEWPTMGFCEFLAEDQVAAEFVAWKNIYTNFHQVLLL